MGWSHRTQNIIELPGEPKAACENGFKESCQDADLFPLEKQGWEWKILSQHWSLGGAGSWAEQNLCTNVERESAEPADASSQPRSRILAAKLWESGQCFQSEWGLVMSTWDHLLALVFWVHICWPLSCLFLPGKQHGTVGSAGFGILETSLVCLSSM